jgi:hypothetical protein
MRSIHLRYLLSVGLLTAAVPLLVAGCGDDDASGVGNACEVDEDCETGECYLGPGGGYCTSPCSEEGDTSECPTDTICKPIQGGARRCLLICGSESACTDGDCDDETCPDGSSCVSISGASARACEPDPG